MNQTLISNQDKLVSAAPDNYKVAFNMTIIEISSGDITSTKNGITTTQKFNNFSSKNLNYFFMQPLFAF